MKYAESPPNQAARTHQLAQAQDRLPIGEVVRRSGIAASTLRFYEEAGLLLSLRSDSGRRHYARSDLRRLAFIRAAQTVGLSLDDIRAALAELPESRTPTAADWARLSKAWRPLLDQHIAELVQLRDTLSSCIGCGCLSLSKCKLYNPGDLAAQRGAGARYLLGDRAQEVLAKLSPLDPAPASSRAAGPGAAPARAKKR